MLQLAASLEQSSKHVVARALVAGAAARKLKLTKAKHVREVPGRGLLAQLKGQQLIVGRLSLLTENEVQLPAALKHNDVKQTAVYVAADNELVGVITLKDEIRSEAADTLARLQQLGLKHMLVVTGDNQNTAKAVAAKLGISEVHAEALPADKLQVLANVDRKRRPLAFVGDGINDAPVLAAADVGLALGAHGSMAASESADVVILQDDLGRVADAYHIARRTFQIAQQSILGGLALSVVLMLIFATGKFTPLLGAVLQEVVDVAVIFNALRAHLTKA